MCAGYPQCSEESVKSPATGVTDDCEPGCEFEESNHVGAGKLQVLSTCPASFMTFIVTMCSPTRTNMRVYMHQGVHTEVREQSIGGEWIHSFHMHPWD